MGADVISMIRTDHHELERLFEMMKTEASSRPLALPLAVAMLTAHSRAEEEQVYPVLAREAGEKEEAEHGVSEHHKAEQLGKRLLGMAPESGEFETALQEWVGAVQHHVAEEESEILPALGKTLGENRLAELGQAFAARRAQELTGQGSGGRRGGSRARGGHSGQRAGRSGSRGGRSGSRAGAGKTREELYEQARKAGIQGRSSMSKAQLERALSRKR